MSRKVALSDLHGQIDWASNKACAEQRDFAGPVDLSAALGIEVESHQMIPEGVPGMSDGKIRFYLGNNFVTGISDSGRQRFTWAHEICHPLL